MASKLAIWMAILAGAAFFGQEEGAGADPLLLSFETSAVGSVPDGWSVEATNQQGPLATWAVVEDPSAPDGGKVLALTEPNHAVNATFNLCWAKDVRFSDGTIDVAFRPDGGFIDDGGGPIWRVQDQNNYYLCRGNTLEGNFRVYVVKDGTRRQLATADLDIEPEAWHQIRVEHRGANIVCYLDGEKLLEATDTTIPGEGGVGLWTKADAATSFDALTISR